MKTFIIILFLLLSGCSFPDTSAQYRVKECMEKGWVATYISTSEKTIFRCEPVSEFNTGVFDLGEEYNLPSPKRYQDED